MVGGELQFWVVAAVLLVLALDGLRRLALGAGALRRGGTDAWALLFLTLAALALRVLATPFTCDIRSPLPMGFEFGGHRWAAAYSVVLHGLFALFGPRPEAVYGLNMLVGALTVPALYVFARRWTGERRIALGAAAVLAVLPIPAKFSASDSPHVLLTLVFLLAGAELLRWREDRRFATLLRALVLFALCANLRPETVTYAAAVPLLLLADPGRWRLSTSGSFLLAAILPLALVVFPAQGLLADARVHWHLAVIDNAFLFHAHAPVPIALLGLWGLVRLVRDPAQRRRAGLLGAALLLPLGVVTGASDLSRTADWCSNCRYFLPSLALVSVFAGAGLVALLHRLPLSTRARRVALLLLPALLSAAWWPLLARNWTHNQEFQFLREALAEVPDGCTIVVRTPGELDVGFEPGAFVSAIAGRRHTWVTARDFLASSPTLEGCVVYDAAAACYARETPPRNRHRRVEAYEELPECVAVCARYSCTPLATAELPAIPYVAETYTRDPVPVGLFRLTHVAEEGL